MSATRGVDCETSRSLLYSLILAMNCPIACAPPHDASAGLRVWGVGLLVTEENTLPHFHISTLPHTHTHTHVHALGRTRKRARTHAHAHHTSSKLTLLFAPLTLHTQHTRKTHLFKLSHALGAFGIDRVRLQEGMSGSWGS